MDALRKAELDLQAEAVRQVDLTYAAVGISLTRYWGWGKTRIKNIFEESYLALEECGSSNEISMIQMLDEETGIELKISESNKGWQELAYLNAKIKLGEMNRAQWIYMRQRQRKWIGPQVMAGMFLGLHRKYGFGYERLVRLLEQVEAVKEEFGNDTKKLSEACMKEVGVKLDRSRLIKE